MSDSISSSVDVAVDAATAFKVFTEEINCWWLQGPINFHDGTQAYEKRILFQNDVFGIYTDSLTP